MAMLSLFYIAAGGALGAVMRWMMGAGVTIYMKQPFPYGTLCVNVLGSFAMGALMAYFMKHDNISQEFRLFLTVGFLGSFTTFSTFSMDAFSLIMRGEAMAAASYMFVSVFLSITAVVLGTILVWKIAS